MKKFLKSVHYGLEGIKYSFLHERNIKIEAAVGLVLISISILIHLSFIKLGIFIFALFLMFAVETMNSSIELLADEVTLKHKKEIGIIKDLAAGASGLMCIGTGILRIIFVITHFVGV